MTQGDQTPANHVVLTATPPVVRALLEEARGKRYSRGVLGVRAQPRWDGPDTFTHEDVPVRVVPCVSALAVREALLNRDPAGWLVLLTDRDDADLGAGVLAHLIGHRVRTPDPWQAVATRFAASGIDARLVSGSALGSVSTQRDLATGLLAVTPFEGWPPAPGGVLTRDHALAAVAQHYLHCGVSGPEMDAVAVFRWSTEPDSATRVADLREVGGDTLTDELLGWLASRCGAAAGCVLALLRAGRLPDLVPLGVVTGVIANEGVLRDGDLDRVSADARIRLETRLGGVSPGRPELISWGRDAATVAGELLLDPQTLAAGKRVIARADALLADLRAEALAEASELLRSGLTERLVRLSRALRCALNAAVPHDVDAPWVQPEDSAAIEGAWDAVAGHRLGDLDHRVPVFRAAVRLARWLATPVSAGVSSLIGLIGRHRDADAWVDSAINHAAVGVGDPDLGRALGAVLEAARRRRDSHDRTFANALATHTASQDPDLAARHLENLLPEVVLPLTRQTPVLLLVMDGMSVGVATEVMSSALGTGAQGWVEALLPAADRRAAALAVFPTLTEISRASLLSGTLVTGAQSQEHRGFSAVVRAAGLTGRLFHKKPLDVSQPGFAVADDVGAAIDDVEGTRLVACVLNTIDDALDRSDPAGTAWGVDAVKHLAPLLERAGRTGRTVILTADHGHVVERRAGTQRSYPDISSSRSRAAGTPGEGEVLLAGPRVLAHGGRAVLAVDERLRYGPLKAGYHGGASPAEAVVPVCVLVPGDVPEGSELVLAAPQEPAWWSGPVRAGAAPALGQPLTLFDEPVAEPSAGAELAAAVLRSRSFARQRALAGRGMTIEHLDPLLAALLDAPDRRLAPAAAAAAAGIPVSRLRGAVAQAQRLLNVEGYPVLRLDVDGATVVLDETLLREQFDVRDLLAGSSHEH